MKTTLTLDEDVAQKTRELAAKLKKPFKVVLNEALRKGLEEVEKPVRRQQYRTNPLLISAVFLNPNPGQYDMC